MNNNNFSPDSSRIVKHTISGTFLLIALLASIEVVPSEITNGGAAIVEGQPTPGSDQMIATKLKPSQIGSEEVVDPADSGEFVGEMYQIGLGWHPADLEDFPKDKFGLVDWVVIMNDELIRPRGSIDPKADEIPPFDLDIDMPSKTGMIEGAYFPHKTHTTLLACGNCHIKIFIPLAGGNDLNMSRIVKGKACGVCHGKVAFPLNDCERCHVSSVAADAIVSAKQ